MDNFKIDIIAKDYESLFHAMEIVCTEQCGPAQGYCIQTYKGIKRLVFYWTVPAREWTTDLGTVREVVNELPFKLDAQGMADWAQRWLKEFEDKDYADNLDHDGSNSHGFRVYNDRWGHIDGAPEGNYGMCAISGNWAWHGK